MSGTTPTLSVFFEHWELFRDPSLTGALAGMMLGMMGVYVVLRRMVFLAATVSQAASFGVAGAYFLGLSAIDSIGSIAPILGALFMTFATLWLIAADTSHEQHRRDSLLGFMFLACAAGTLVVGTKIVEEIQDIESVLFGTAVAVLPSDFRLMTILAVLILAVHIWGWRGFSAVSFDRTGALVRGLPVRGLEFGLFIGLGVGLAVSTRVLGALPTFAFTVLPALAAVNIAPNVRLCLMTAALLGAISGFGGYLLAFLFDFPVGATQTLVAAAFASLTWLFGHRHSH
ncbi:MAG: ABC transporter permease [Myxococcales bacterium]|nr:ABC transporter permease [Myxococcales bacterium]|tara:strand:- start:423 stop:1280 length:858 start_codon:yes stop_codon:yes gene_type:complete